MTFVSLVLIQFFKAYNFRSDRHSVLNDPFANKWLNIAIIWELVMLGLIVYVPVGKNLRHIWTDARRLVNHRRRSVYRLTSSGISEMDGAARMVWRTSLELRQLVRDVSEHRRPSEMLRSGGFGGSDSVIKSAHFGSKFVESDGLNKIALRSAKRAASLSDSNAAAE